MAHVPGDPREGEAANLAAEESMHDVSRRMAVGAAWMVLLKLSERSLGLISIVILARLLIPADFGLVALATSFIAMLELMGAFSFDVALIRDQNASRQHYDTVWTITVLFALLTALILCLSARAVAAFYAEPRLEAVLYCLAAGTLVGGFANVGVVAFRKEMDFRKEFLYMTGRKLAAVSTTIPLAFLLQNYWALVTGMVVSVVAGVALSYCVHPFRPRFSVVHFRELFRFSKWLFLSNALVFLDRRACDFIIGKISGPQALGAYSIAFEIATLPVNELVAPINRAVIPGYAKLAGDIGLLRAEYLKVLALIALFALPVGVGIAAIADLIVPVVLGVKWAGATPLIQVLALYGTAHALNSNGVAIFVVTGNTRLPAALAAASVLVLLPTLVAATMAYGSLGATWGFLGVALLITPLTFWFVFRKLGLTIQDFFGISWRPFCASLTMGAAVYLLSVQFLPYARGGMGGVVLLGATASGAIIYVFSVLVLWFLSGRPTGAEHAILGQVRSRLSRLR
jgi:O-antigen/teichoic acid export membrane protein